MERSIVIGNNKRSFVIGHKFFTKIFKSANDTRHRTQDKKQFGFSLLELLIAMFILIILLSVALPTYQRSIQHAREVVLKENLFQMRRAIEQYSSDKGRLPQSLEDLKEAKYLREIPTDPISERKEWNPKNGDDPNSTENEQGLIDVKSLSEGKDSVGIEYKDY